MTRQAKLRLALLGATGIVVVAVVVALLLASAGGGPSPQPIGAPPAGTTQATTRATPSSAPPAPPAPRSPLPVPRSVTDFDRDPCRVASGDEVRAALAHPFDLIAANILQPAGQPSTLVGAENRPEATGCGFGFIAAGTDSAETFHAVTVRVTHWRTGGSGMMAGCRTAARKQPSRYRVVKLGSEACLGPGARMLIRVGARYYTVTVTAVPGHADPTGDDFQIGTLTMAAARLVATRLPR